MPNQIKKSEILFIYESIYNIPNGDPFTGEQRFDEETKKILISDVRIKRYIRDYLMNKGYEIFVTDDTEKLSNTKGAAAARRFINLKENYQNLSGKQILLQCVDARLFGGIVTIKKSNGDSDESAFNITGPVQFALLNPSLNEVEPRIHQNTSVFSSDEEKKQGAIGTTTLVPYAINQIHGWINPYSAEETNLSEDDLNVMFKALWDSINNVNTRSKSNQNSLLLLNIIYKEPDKKIYGLDKLIKIDTRDKNGDQLRSKDDFDFDFTKLIEICKSDIIEKVCYFTEFTDIKNKLSDTKFEKITFQEFKSNE